MWNSQIIQCLTSSFINARTLLKGCTFFMGILKTLSKIERSRTVDDGDVTVSMFTMYTHLVFSIGAREIKQKMKVSYLFYFSQCIYLPKYIYESQKKSESEMRGCMFPFFFRLLNKTCQYGVSSFVWVTSLGWFMDYCLLRID